MKEITVLMLCLFFVTACGGNHPAKSEVITNSVPAAELIINIDRTRLSNTLESLNHPRAFGTDGEECASAYLRGTLDDYGYCTSVQEFPVYDQNLSSFTVEYHRDFFKLNPLNSRPLGTGRNIVARSKNYSNAKKTIYLTAHYDTTRSTNGIMDNASGVSVVLEVARQLKDYNGPVNIEFVLFSAEEWFRTGSKSFVANLSDEQKTNIIGVINVDMVGEKDAGEVVMATVFGEHNVFTLMINDSVEERLPVIEGGMSDELPFYLAQIPALTLANRRPNYNRDKEDDQLQYIDLDQLASVAHMVTSFVANFDTERYGDMLDKQRFPSNMTTDPFFASSDISKEFTLQGVSVDLAANGHDCGTVYIYESAGGRTCTVTEQRKLFVDPTVYSSWDSIQGNDGTHYHIVEDPQNPVKAYYVIGGYFGEINGDLSSEEVQNIVNAICRTQYKR